MGGSSDYGSWMGTGAIEWEGRRGPNRPDVIDEVIAGEAVVVHLGTGRYFAFDAAATELWTWFGAVGRASDELDQVLAPAADAWASAARSLVAAWSDEGLFMAVGAADGPTSPPATPALVVDGPAPAMRVFTDLEDLLLLDPIHDVALGDDGFPVARPPG